MNTWALGCGDDGGYVGISRGVVSFSLVGWFLVYLYSNLAGLAEKGNLLGGLVLLFSDHKRQRASESSAFSFTIDTLLAVTVIVISYVARRHAAADIRSNWQPIYASLRDDQSI